MVIATRGKPVTGKRKGTQESSYLIASGLMKRLRGGESPFANVWEFLTRACWTKDEASGRIRKFPTNLIDEKTGEQRFEYLRHIAEVRLTCKVMAIEKSRRMMLTWLMLAIYLYDMMTECNHANFIGSDKLGKSAYLLGDERMKFIYDHIPPVSEEIAFKLAQQGLDLTPFRMKIWPDKPTLIAEGKEQLGFNVLRCPETGSFAMAMAQGAEQLQQYTASNVLCDEFARWPWAREAWRNIQPCLQGGGHADLITTPELGSYAYDLFYDTEQA